jgi:TetR/AcrR family transcriptional regulator
VYLPLKTFTNLPEVKRAVIETAAIDEFSENSFQSASISKIVAQASIAKGSFYQYFIDKRDLYQHLLSIAQKKKIEMVGKMTPPSMSMDTFGYLRWMIQVAVMFELRHPKLARIERQAFLDAPLVDPTEPEEEGASEPVARFREFLMQGVMHDDIAPWVDIEMAAFYLASVHHQISRYMILRMGDKAKSLANGSVDIAFDPLTQDLFDNLMELIEAGMARDPQIRKVFYSK